MKRPTIGVLTWREGKRFAEPAYFRRLLRAGQELGSTVFLFSPKDVLAQGKQVRGFILDANGNWQARMFDRPDAVFDRYRYTPTQAFKDYVAFRRTSNFLYANNRLANKWRVHEVLYRDERMHRWLPETFLYNRANFVKMLGRHSFLYVKPLNGTGGATSFALKRRIRATACWDETGSDRKYLPSSNRWMLFCVMSIAGRGQKSILCSKDFGYSSSRNGLSTCAF